MPRFEGFVEQIIRISGESPYRTASVFCRDADEDSQEVITYGALDDSARSRAADILAYCRSGDRALLLYPQGLEFLRTFIGCLYAGVVPVVAPPPGGQRHQHARTSGIMLDCAASLVLTDAQTMPEVSAWLDDSDLGQVECIATGPDGTSGSAWSADIARPRTSGSDLAFLQYTSGSTSSPRGVMISHANLAHNLRSLIGLCEARADVRFCNWLPMFHDMGLIFTLLNPLFAGGTAVQLSATTFIKRPHVWLELIMQHDAAVICAPNFAYELCTRRVTDQQLSQLDLSCVRFAGNGAEPINPETLARFAERFGPAGIRPDVFCCGYGLAEATLVVSACRRNRPPKVVQVHADALEQNVLTPALPGDRPQALVSCGDVRDLDVRIVDPATCEPLPDGRTGEIWIRGESVALGYWGKEEETEQTFRAVTAAGEGGFLRTGDLGAFYEDELYITGRIKEMLVVHGRNLYPQDIEREIRTIDTAFTDRQASVFSLPGAEEEVVVVQELRPAGRCEDDLQELARSVKVSVGHRLGLRVANVVFVRPGHVRKTTSGKIQRTLMRELFMSGALEPIYEDLDAATRRRYRRATTASSTTIADQAGEDKALTATAAAQDA